MNSKLNDILNNIHNIECSVMRVLKDARRLKQYRECLNISEEAKLNRITRSCIDILAKIDEI